MAFSYRTPLLVSLSPNTSRWYWGPVLPNHFVVVFTTYMLGECISPVKYFLRFFCLGSKTLQN
nr:MAG TPA: hypothetical protein [Microviridae sp.]